MDTICKLNSIQGASATCSNRDFLAQNGLSQGIVASNVRDLSGHAYLHALDPTDRPQIRSESFFEKGGVRTQIVGEEGGHSVARDG